MSAERPEWLSPDEGETVEWVGEPELASKAAELITGVLTLPLFGFGLLLIVPAYLQVENTDYVVTNQSLYTKRGIFSTNIQGVELDKIQNTEYSQSFIEKQLGYGTVGVSTAGGDGVELSFEAIANAREVQDRVRELSKEYRGSGTEAGEGASTADPLDELADELARTREALEHVEAAVETALQAQKADDDAASGGEGGATAGNADQAGSDLATEGHRPDMHPRAVEFRDRAREEHGVEVDVEEFPEGTKTAADAAEALGCDVAQIASSIVFLADGEPVVVVTSGANRVSEAKLADVLGVDAATVRTADPEEVKEAVGWSIGGVPPLCHDGDVTTYLDETLLAHDTVWAAAGTPRTVFPIDPERLRAIADADAVDVAE